MENVQMLALQRLEDRERRARRRHRVLLLTLIEERRRRREEDNRRRARSCWQREWVARRTVLGKYHVRYIPVIMHNYFTILLYTLY